MMENSIKRICRIFCAAAILLAGIMAWNETAYAAESVEDNENGTVTVNYENSNEKTILVLVENSESKTQKRYYYKLKEGKNDVDIPLTEGNGLYKIRICQVRSDNKAVVLESDVIELELKDEKAVFLQSSVIVNYAVSKKVTKKASELTKDCSSNDEKVEKIFRYVIKNFTYDNDGLEDKINTQYYVPDISETYKDKTGICYDISCVMAAMLRSLGIETKVVTGNTPNVSTYHAWNQVYDSKGDKWYTIDATYDICKYKTVKNPSMKKKDADYKDIVYTY